MRIINKIEGMSEESALAVWENIEKNASYQFNRAHSVEYSVISYWCAYLKTHFSGEFFAALLTTADKEEKLQSAVADARRYNIVVVPPSINISTNRFEFWKREDETLLITPFSKLKGLSDKTSQAIIRAREKVGGRFTSKKHLLETVERRVCNIKHVDILDKVGAFAGGLIPGTVDAEPSQISARHPDRIKDQIELMPGLICEYVKADRHTKLSDVSLQAGGIVRSIKECKDCQLHEEAHCIPTSGSKVKFMVISDSPNSSEASEGKMMKGDSCKYLSAAIKSSGLSKSNGYYTALVKTQKPKGDKSFSNEVLLSCQKFIETEIKVINPPVIVALGGATIRHFFPDIKGSWAELAGRVIYSKELDASIVCGINPQMCYFREEAQEMLNDIFKKVAEIVD